MSDKTRRAPAHNWRIKSVPLGSMKIAPGVSQREKHSESRINDLARRFDIDLMGLPVLSERDGHYYIVDGRHRIEAARIALSLDDSQLVECKVFTGLDEAGEARLFRELNNTKAVSPFDKFKTGVVAGEPVECDVNRIVLASNLRVSRDKSVEGSVAAVGTLVKVYKRAGGPTLGRSLRIIRDAFGDAGLEAPVIDGIALVGQRFNGQVKDERLVKKLADMHGGVGGLMNKAGQLRRMTGNSVPECVAAATVDVYNRNARKTERLPDWFRA